MENKTNKKTMGILIGIAAVLVILIIVLVVSFMGGSDTENSDNGNTGSTSQATEVVEDKTPVFMYFVSKNDEGYSDYMAMVEELKSEYGDEVDFNIVDVDENPDSKQNFPVDGNTPMLIMTNKTNDISAIEFSCSDKEKLTEDIEATLK